MTSSSAACPDINADDCSICAVAHTFGKLLLLEAMRHVKLLRSENFFNGNLKVDEAVVSMKSRLIVTWAFADRIYFCYVSKSFRTLFWRTSL